MKIGLFLTVLTLTSVHAATFSQQKVSLNVKNQTLLSVLDYLQEQTDYTFLFSSEDVGGVKGISLQVQDEDFFEVLKKCLTGTGLAFETNKQLIVLKKEVAPTAQQQKYIRITGRVTDTRKAPLPGVTVMIKGTHLGASTDMDGKYVLSLPDAVKEEYVLLFSMVGMETVEVKYAGQETINVEMKDAVNELEDVVVTGMFTRKAESFTGSATTFRKEQLQAAGNQNLLKSLKNLDPAFIIMESLEFGSDPNRTPTIQMRGQSSFPNLQGNYEGNPNQPLFILDGFETTVEKVYDLDMNRVASVTLLKDAAAKAIYGSKAANGVVVIETVRPQSGELRVSYSGDVNLEIPDLTGYNLMNAEEKLAFEKERGMYYKYAFGASDVATLDAQYEQRYSNVVKGVDTYWLSKPLRTGVGHRHSLMLEGGDDRMRYQAGLSYNNVAGVMKESERNTLGINVSLSYTYRNLIFRNSLEYTRNWSENSPYGSFSDYAALNQYFQPYDENGNAVKILGYYGTYNAPVYNPLYNATLNTKSTSDYSDLTDNFNVDWKINDMFRLTGRLSYTRQENNSDVFYPGNHTMFASYDANGLSDRKGKYTKGNGFNQYITADAGLNYNQTFGRHLLFANVTWNMSSKRYVSTSVTAEGFGNDNMDNISFATQYENNGKPSGSDEKTREIGVIGALNYSFADRYLLDASVRFSGSSMYGSDNRWGTFWSFGLGWNVHKEKFLENSDWLQQLKIRSSFGYTGSQSFDPYQARARYEYGDIVYNDRLGAELMGLPNSALKWQRTRDWNTGVDLMIKRFLTARFDYYISTTTDLLSDMTVVPSMGFSSYKANLGKVENKGYELSLAVTPWRDDNRRAWITLTASALHNDNKIKEIYDVFRSWNEKQDALKEEMATEDTYNTEEYKKQMTRLSTKYYEGQSMTALWGVRSLGINPVNGEEMYLDKDGKTTSTWSTADEVVIGDSNPKLRGNFGLNGGYRGFTFSLICSYKFGGDLYNTTLIDKVENVTGYDNLDKRILDSWRNVGDVSQYRALKVSAGGQPTYTKPTSRFVQRDNEIYFTSLNVGYDFYGAAWLKKLSLERLKCSFYTSDLLRLSTVKVERGTSYPFARTFSFSLQATF